MLNKVKENFVGTKTTYKFRKTEVLSEADYRMFIGIKSCTLGSENTRDGNRDDYQVSDNHGGVTPQ